jgi:hypothetical protein
MSMDETRYQMIKSNLKNLKWEDDDLRLANVGKSQPFFSNIPFKKDK